MRSTNNLQLFQSIMPAVSLAYANRLPLCRAAGDMAAIDPGFWSCLKLEWKVLGTWVASIHRRHRYNQVWSFSAQKKTIPLDNLISWDLGGSAWIYKQN